MRDTENRTGKHKKRGSWLRRLAAMSLAMVLSVSAIHVVQPGRVEAQAGNGSVVYIQTSVDTELWKIISAVVHESVKDRQWLWGTKYAFEDTSEARRGEATADAINHPLDALNALTPGYTTSGYDVNKSAGSILTFPHTYITTTTNALFTGLFEGIKSATNADEENAIEISNTLTNDLNEAFLICNGGAYVPAGEDQDQVVHYRDDMSAFLSKVTSAYDGATTVTYTGQGGTVATITKGPATADVGTVNITVNGETKNYTCVMKKQVSSGEYGVSTISWLNLAYEAFANAWIGDESLRVTPDNLYASAPSSFESILVDLFQGLVNWIKSALGLWNIDDLVFNFGNRSEPTYVNGLFPKSWEPTVWALFFVFEVAAFLVLAIILVTNIIRKAMSTVNPIMRVSLMDQVKDLLIVAFVLGSLPLVIQLITNLSATITGVFGDLLEDNQFDERFNSLAQTSGSLGGVIMQILYLAITISFNVMYAIRAYLLAALIAASPLFVVLYAIGDDNKKMLCKAWISEFLSNIFIQPIHAFILTVVLFLPGSTRPIEALVTLYCVMPLAGIIQRMFFGMAGSATLGTAQRGISAARSNFHAFRRDAGLAAGTVLGAAHILGSRGKRNNASSSESSGSGETASGESGAGAGGGNGGGGGDGGGGVGSNALFARSTGTMGRKTGAGGDQTYASQGKTPREQLGDTIKSNGIIPSTGVAAVTAGGLAGSAGGPQAKTKPGIPVPGAGTTDKAQPPIGDHHIIDKEKGPALTPAPGARIWEVPPAAGADVPGKTGGPIPVPDLDTKPAPDAPGLEPDIPQPVKPIFAGGGSDLSEVLRSVQQPDGSTLYQTSRQDMRDIGFATYNGSHTGASYMTTDTGYRGIGPDGQMRVSRTASGAYTAADARNLGQMAQIFAHGTEAQKSVLRRAGYDFVAPEMRGQAPTGRFQVQTNKNFGRAMGYHFTGSERNNSLQLNRQPGATGEMRRTPDVGQMMNRDSYLRQSEPKSETHSDGSTTYSPGVSGYTSTGIRLGNNDMSHSVSTIPLSKEAQQSDGSYQVSAEALRDQGISMSKTDDGRSAITYQAGILGKDQDGATVYQDQHPSMMPMANRESVAQLQEMWSGGEANQAWMRSQGVDAVVPHDDGSVTVVYNEAAAKAMGGSILANDDGSATILPATPDGDSVKTVMPLPAQVQATDGGHVIVPTQQPGQAHDYINDPGSVRMQPIANTVPVTAPIHAPAPVAQPSTEAPAPIPAPAPAQQAVTQSPAPAPQPIPAPAPAQAPAPAPVQVQAAPAAAPAPVQVTPAPAPVQVQQAAQPQPQAQVQQAASAPAPQPAQPQAKASEGLSSAQIDAILAAQAAESRQTKGKQSSNRGNGHGKKGKGKGRDRDWH